MDQPAVLQKPAHRMLRALKLVLTVLFAPLLAALDAVIEYAVMRIAPVRRARRVLFLDLGDIMGSLSAIIKVVLTLTVIGATIGLLFTSIADIVGEFSTGSTNSTVADLLLPVFGIVVALAGVVMIVRRVLAAAA